MPTFTGTNPERQSIGLPGHCDRCAEVGHVKAHPDLSCGDVGCEPPSVCPTCHSDDCEATWGERCPVRAARLRNRFIQDMQDALQRGIDNGVDIHAERISVLNPDSTVSVMTVKEV